MICWGRSVGCFIYSFVIQVISEKILYNTGFTAVWEIFYMKIIATIIPTDLITDLLLSSSYPFLQTKTKN